ncbi:hypothetical protein ACO34A_22915 (plasmid) [Rhizobium sp. ACO-34A]|nr:MFS transporter [Rhizobium sp. ACO-34A]ATN36643.1 hypothetical protein ACO34A_22915 [Rhizobium sp. ACO-34A]
MTNENARKAPAEAGADGLAMPRRAVAVIAITIAAVLSVLDGAMLNVALPRIAEELSVSAQSAVWVVNAYQLTAVICLLPTVVIADRIGYGRTFSAGIFLYVLASVAGFFSEGFVWLLGARILQGLGSAGVMSCASALLRASYPGRLFGTGVALNTSAVTFAAAAGPSLGALVLTAGGNWRFLFLIGVPFGVAAWICTRALPNNKGRRRPLGIVSVALNAVSLGLGIIAFSVLPKDTLTGSLLLAGTVIAWLLWVRVDLASEAPLLPFDLFRIPPFSFAIAASVSMFAAQSASLISLPFLFIGLRGMSVLETGALMTAWPVCAAMTSMLAPRMGRRFQVATLCMTGAALLAAGLGWMALLPAATPSGLLVPGLVLGGVAVGLFQAPNMHAMLSASPRSRSGAAGSVQAIARVGGSTLGASLAGFCFALPGIGSPLLALLAAGLLAATAFGINAFRAGYASGNISQSPGSE